MSYRIAEHDLEEAVETGERAASGDMRGFDANRAAAAFNGCRSGGRVQHDDAVVHLREFQVQTGECVVVVDDSGQRLKPKSDEHVTGEGVAVDRSQYAARVGA